MTPEEAIKVAQHVKDAGNITSVSPSAALELVDALLTLDAEVRRLRSERDTPQISNFLEAVRLEALHQRARWSSGHDAGKTDADWFWLLGYLSGKALTAASVGNFEKALHHTISSAAALLNWHAALSGAHSLMRPGIDPAPQDRVE